MNKQKLKMLVAEAGFDLNRLLAPHPGGFPQESLLALESLVELVIEECATAVRERGGMCGCLAAGWIKEHFEVNK